MGKISKSFCEVDYYIFSIPYKRKSAKSLRNALAKPLRNTCENVVYNKISAV